jgi:cephalosporin hydroxylase
LTLSTNIEASSLVDEIEKFYAEVRHNITRQGQDSALKGLTSTWLRETAPYKYSYNFTWLGCPIIQFPQDIVAMQEIIWRVKPDLIIETGIAHGGSLIFYASLLELLGGDGQVLGIDVDIRSHNRVEIEKHPLFKRITMLEGSSVAPETITLVQEFARNKRQVLVGLDSHHTHEHVYRELELYSPLVTKGSYLVVFDTAIEDMPEDFFPDRPWRKGNNPKTAVWEFLKTTDRFEIDEEIQNKLLITVAPDGYLRCVKD